MNKKEVETVLGMNINTSVHEVLPWLTGQHWFDLAKTAAQKILIKSEIFDLLNLLLVTKNSAMDGCLDKSLCWVNQRSAREIAFVRNIKSGLEFELDTLCAMKSYLTDTLLGVSRPNDHVILDEIKTVQNHFCSRLHLPERHDSN